MVPHGVDIVTTGLPTGHYRRLVTTCYWSLISLWVAACIPHRVDMVTTYWSLQHWSLHSLRVTTSFDKMLQVYSLRVKYNT